MKKASRISATDHQLLILTSLLALFALLTLSVLSNTLVVAGDIRIENMLYDLRTPSLLDFFSWITLLGNALTIAVITSVSFYLCSRTRRFKKYAPGLLVTVLGAAASDYILKLVVERARPSGPVATLIDHSYSFPSGHATIAVTLYGYMGYVLLHTLHNKKEEAASLFVSGALIASIGFSRLYLGVHYPSDVVAGYLIGTMWLLIGIFATKRFTTRRSR